MQAKQQYTFKKKNSGPDLTVENVYMATLVAWLLEDLTGAACKPKF